MFYGIRNFVCMADFEVIQTLIHDDGLIEIIPDGLKNGNEEQITTILESKQTFNYCLSNRFSHR